LGAADVVAAAGGRYKLFIHCWSAQRRRRALRVPSTPQTESVPVTLLTGTLLFLADAASGRAKRRQLLTNHKKDEGAGLHLAAAFARCGCVEIGSREKDIVGLQVEAHGASTLLRGDVLDDRIFVR